MIKIGFAKDIHQLKKGNKDLILGSVLIPSEWEIISHSDGDLIIHSLISAILGVISEKTIGEFFSDTDEKTIGECSTKLLKEVLNNFKSRNLNFNNIDITIICEQIILKDYLEEIKEKLKIITECENIGIKVTRFENENNLTIECYTNILIH